MAPPLEEPGGAAREELPSADDDDSGGWDVPVLAPPEDAGVLDPGWDVDASVVLVPDAPADDADAGPLVTTPLEEEPAVTPPLAVAPEPEPETEEEPAGDDVAAAAEDDAPPVPEEEVPTAPLEVPPVARQNPPSHRSLTRQSDAPVLHTRLQVSPSYAWSAGQLAVFPQASSSVVMQTSARARTIMGQAHPSGRGVSTGNPSEQRFSAAAEDAAIVGAAARC